MINISTSVIIRIPKMLLKMTVNICPQIVITPNWCRLTKALHKLRVDLVEQKGGPPHIHDEVRKCIDSIEDSDRLNGVYNESILEEKLTEIYEYLNATSSMFINTALYGHFIEAMDKK
jgi:hypothetical protein